MDEQTQAPPTQQPETKDAPAPKKQGRWSRFVQAVGEAIGQAKFGS